MRPSASSPVAGSLYDMIWKSAIPESLVSCVFLLFADLLVLTPALHVYPFVTMLAGTFLREAVPLFCLCPHEDNGLLHIAVD